MRATVATILLPAHSNNPVESVICLLRFSNAEPPIPYKMDASPAYRTAYAVFCLGLCGALPDAAGTYLLG